VREVDPCLSWNGTSLVYALLFNWPKARGFNVVTVSPTVPKSNVKYGNTFLVGFKRVDNKT
jgi:hypothetical protein